MAKREGAETVRETEGGGVDTGAAGVAIALDGARSDPNLRGDIKSYLGRQQVLIDAQLDHLHEQLHQLKLRRWSERLTLVLQAMTAAAGLAVAITIGALAWDAHQSRNLVIDAFSTPPDMAKNGLTGEVVAAEVEDRINALQAETQSTRAPESFANDRGGDVKVEIPETGVSLGELKRFLSDWLGRQTHITGAVVRTADGGVKILARMQNEPADEASGPEKDFDAVLGRLAEQIYGRVQPFRYGVYLVQHDRTPEARTVFQRLATNGPAKERGWALEGLALTETSARAQIAGHRLALAADPTLALAELNLATTAGPLGHYEESLQAARRTLQLLSRRDRGQIAEGPAAIVRLQETEAVDELLGDQTGALAELDRIAALPQFYSSRDAGQADRVSLLADRHDLALARAEADRVAADDAAATVAVRKYGIFAAPHASVAAASGDWNVVRQVALIEPATTGLPSDGIASSLWPLKAVALAHVGHVPEAEALIGSTGLDCYPCLIARAKIAEIKGDRPSADRWFAEAARQGPSLPQAWEAKGEALLARGQIDAAGKAFARAHELGPHWADPLKGLGDVEARRGRWNDALRDYREALEAAPNWDALRRALAVAKARAG
jgi:tetratricopeptide (TPR) repeat protein